MRLLIHSDFRLKFTKSSTKSDKGPFHLAVQLNSKWILDDDYFMLPNERIIKLVCSWYIFQHIQLIFYVLAYWFTCLSLNMTYLPTVFRHDTCRKRCTYICNPWGINHPQSIFSYVFSFTWKPLYLSHWSGYAYLQCLAFFEYYDLFFT